MHRQTGISHASDARAIRRDPFPFRPALFARLDRRKPRWRFGLISDLSRPSGLYQRVRAVGAQKDFRNKFIPNKPMELHRRFP
jgi:hypothetical protein